MKCFGSCVVVLLIQKIFARIWNLQIALKDIFATLKFATRA